MKFTKTDIAILKANIDGLLKESNKSLDQWLSIYKKEDRTLTRFVFDLFYATQLKIGDGVGIRAKPGRFDPRTITVRNCSDDHIKTAVLKCIGKNAARSLKG